MGRFYGEIGISKSVEIRPGYFDDDVIPLSCSGNLIRNTKRLQADGKVVDNINISNQFSIVAKQELLDDPFIIKYVKYKGTKWKVTDIEVDYPRLVISVGGIYNGK